MGNNMGNDMKTAKDVLLCIAERFTNNPDSWLQGAMSDAIGRHCLIGAIWDAETSFGYEACCLAEVHARAHCPGTGSLVAWNDATGRKVEEVVSFLKEVADAL